MGISFSRVLSPIPINEAIQIERFLCETLEYGDYSFRSALSGGYSPKLGCCFSLAMDADQLIGAAGAIFSINKPAQGIFGPVVVAKEYRRRGIASEMIGRLIRWLESQGCRSLYLGVKRQHPAVDLYRCMGFYPYQGIVLRRELGGHANEVKKNVPLLDSVHFQDIGWEDYADVSALMVHPSEMITVDYQNGIFSSLYVEPQKFLPLFPAMMKRFKTDGGLACGICAGREKALVGIAHVTRMNNPAQRHLAYLDFFVQDSFVRHAKTLVQETLKRAFDDDLDRVLCAVVTADEKKCKILDKLGTRRVAEYKDHVVIQNKTHNVAVYALDRS